MSGTGHPAMRFALAVNAIHEAVYHAHRILRATEGNRVSDHIKKRLQVFVSSTYEDLKEERQAAVEAILTAGHIPAGMELFTAGDQSQMDVIRDWIDESDIFLLKKSHYDGG
ncbi:DUF4062 domain-containing protein [Candidatus Thiosymbion oneisti]|uniref:DUF4062 domain-containing protein n=1 Tax=Candidatus Thiosymbion oneisti TaxID=589554 RepID=UPI000AD72235|nr:DUF4062 domain-containing protein [Candidatus Thiosymbion oneisti]